MKKLIVLILIAAGGFLLYKYYFSSPSDNGAFDEDGNPTVIVFTMANCPPCVNVANELKKKNIAFEEINALNSEGKSKFEKFGENGLPLTLIGKHKILGNDIPAVETALAEIYGMDVFTSAEQNVMKNHFDDNGNPIVVMYGVSWCPYCNKLREYFVKNNIPFVDLDIEKDDKAKMDYQTLKGSGYPLTYVGYRRIVGFDKTKIKNAVDELLKIN